MTPDFMKPRPSQDLMDLVLKTKLTHDLLFFTRYFFNQMQEKKFIVAHHHLAIAEALTRVVSGQCRRLIINVPPRYGKTEIAVKMFLAWIMANNSAAKNIHISYSDDLALDNSSGIRDILKCEEYQRMFPVKIRTDSDSKKKWYSDTGGGLYAVAAGGAITGFGAGAIERVISGSGSPADGFPGCIVIDDPLKPDDAISTTMREAINRRYNNTIASRTNSEDTPIVVIMQRLHEDDLSGFLLEGGSGDEWEHINLPAINDDGSPLWPEKHSVERLKAMETADPYTFAGQYMQRPAPLGGGLFKDSWWQYYKVAPVTLWRCLYADTALKTKEENDYTVLQIWGKTADHKIILLDQKRGKWEAPELLTNTVSFWNKHKAVAGMGTLRSAKIEDKASGTGLIQQLPGKGIPVDAIQRNIDKVTRAQDGGPYIASGMVYIPEDAEWVSDYVAEFSAFPNGKHDDQIDPTLDAIDDLLAGGSTMLIPSETIISSMQAGSGIYLGTDPLICGVYVARDDTEHSVIQFRRGKDAMTEQTYCISYEKSKDPLVLLNLVTRVISKHKPDMSFIADSNLSGVISDKMVDLGFNALRINMHQNADQVLKYSNKLAECCWDLRVWMMGGGSIQNDDVLEQSLVLALQDYKKDKLVIVGETPRLKALALTFAYDVPDRVEEQTYRDRHVAKRDDDGFDYDPLG